MKRWKCLFEGSKSSSERKTQRRSLAIKTSHREGKFQRVLQVWQNGSHDKGRPLLKEEQRKARNTSNWLAFKKAMKAAWSETSMRNRKEKMSKKMTIYPSWLSDTRLKRFFQGKSI
ncbi:hypothetical protein HAX54_031645 [Datura stramonium]|uniref:Uncharacterized protein n=1 Tax=Datura stramonium TaxID=4076 RepID=A0ABS8SC24_DATST|nr:hypothetical protein [Datura stramonium]